jgi:hypothetical protein
MVSGQSSSENAKILHTMKEDPSSPFEEIPESNPQDPIQYL